jgi:HD-GYP domain-containing protein (c-di-GMP phosphodiesterase class II)
MKYIRIGRGCEMAEIDIGGGVLGGTHVCQLYDTKEDLIDLIVPFFKAGLENNELCVWITSEPLEVTEAKLSLSNAVDNFENYTTNHQIDIIDAGEWYTKSGKFNPDRALQDLLRKEELALEKGFKGLRISGNTSWLNHESWEILTKYEAAVDTAIQNRKIVAACSYPRPNCTTSDVVNIVSNHNSTIMKRESNWKRVENRRLEEAKHSSSKLIEIIYNSIHAMVKMIEIRYPYTALHQKRVALLACDIAKRMAFFEDQIDTLRAAGLVHDIGTIAVPIEILNKSEELSQTERALVEMHPHYGYEILSTLDTPWPIAQIVYQHHERLNGSGYPNGISGEDIIPEARVLALADVVEAMLSGRPHRPAQGLDRALEEISRNRGILYDSQVVDACLKLFSDQYSF